MSSEDTAGVTRSRRKISLRLGGLLTVVIGLLCLYNGFQALTGGEESTSGPYITPDALCGTAIIIFGVIALAGGISALMAKHFSLALAGALVGMAGGGWVSFFLGVLAFMFYFFSDEDF